MQEFHKLSDRKKEILYGLILGDLYYETQRLDRKTFRLKFEASDKNKLYLFHLYDLFKEWTLKSPRQCIRFNHLGNKVITWRFHTIATEDFAKIAIQFYPSNKKTIPQNLWTSPYMTELALAYWFMDDGSYEKKNRKATILHTEGFTAEEVNFLCRGLNKKWGLKCSRHISKKRYFIIYIWAKSLTRLKELIGSYVIPCMQYKLEIPVTRVDDIV